MFFKKTPAQPTSEEVARWIASQSEVTGLLFAALATRLGVDAKALSADFLGLIADGAFDEIANMQAMLMSKSLQAGDASARLAELSARAGPP